MILVHDSMNEEIRAGSSTRESRAAGRWSTTSLTLSRVHLAGGGRATRVWGGFALILCDTRGSCGYSRSPRQWRYYEPYEAIHWMRAELLP